MVGLFKKSLYGLKQSLRQCYLRFNEFMITHRYYRSQYDSCAYYRDLPFRDSIYLFLYVVDMLITCKQREKIERLKNKLSSEFDMKNLGLATRILIMQIMNDRYTRTYSS